MERNCKIKDYCTKTELTIINFIYKKNPHLFVKILTKLKILS